MDWPSGDWFYRRSIQPWIDSSAIDYPAYNDIILYLDDFSQRVANELEQRVRCQRVDFVLADDVFQLHQQVVTEFLVFLDRARVRHGRPRSGRQVGRDFLALCFERPQRSFRVVVRLLRSHQDVLQFSQLVVPADYHLRLLVALCL